MGFLDFKKPKYRHKDPSVRMSAIKEMGSGESEVLAELAVNDSDREVRCAAIEMIVDPDILDRLSKNSLANDLPVISARREQLLYERIIDESDLDRCLENLREISSPQLLAKISVNHDRPEIRCNAVEKIDDQNILAEILEHNCGKRPAKIALAKISDEKLLHRLSESAAAKSSRQAAAERLAEMESLRNQKSSEEMVCRTLSGFKKEAAGLCDVVDIEEAAAGLGNIKSKWHELDPEGNHPDYAEFKQICLGLAEKYEEIKIRRAEEREKAFRNEELQTGLGEICTAIERLTGSTDPDVEREKTRAVANWHKMLEDTAGKATPAATIVKRFTTACRAFDETRIKVLNERKQVEEIRRDCQMAGKFIGRGGLGKAASLLAEAEKKFSAIKFKYFNRAAAEKLLSETTAELSRAGQAEEKRSIERQRQICEDLDNLGSKIDNRTEQKLQDLRQIWQALPRPNDPEAEKLAERFNAGAAELAEKLLKFKEEKDWQLWANLTLKEKLTERVEALENEENLATVFETVTSAQAEWKKIGPIPPKKSQKLWDRFHFACNRHFTRTEPYLEERKTEREKAMARRREICALAEELAGSNEWRKTAETLKTLQKEWRTLVPGPHGEERKLYKKFRKNCDRFFSKRKENFHDREEERRKNLPEKEKLCEAAERLAAEPQPDYSKKFRGLQAAWKEIGPVPKGESEKIWERFRAACDNYFAWLEEERRKNFSLKEELCREAEEVVSEKADTGNPKKISAKLQELQKQWREIGPLPRGQSEELWQRFRHTCNTFFESWEKEIEKEKEKRRRNQNRKEKLLALAEELAEGGSGKKSAAALKELQKEWKECGAAFREIDNDLNKRFQALCDAYFAGRRQYFADLKKEQLENQKRKESLCLRLENILGIAHQSAKQKEKALSLAEELKQAMEDNFMLAGLRGEKKALHEEVKRIEEEWRKTGPVTRDQVEPLTARYKKALDQYYQNRRKK